VLCRGERPGMRGGRRPLLRERPINILAFPIGCFYRKQLETWLHKSGLIPYRIMEFSTIETIIGCVSAGMGDHLPPQVGPEREFSLGKDRHSFSTRRCRPRNHPFSATKELRGAQNTQRLPRCCKAICPLPAITYLTYKRPLRLSQRPLRLSLGTFTISGYCLPCCPWSMLRQISSVTKTGAFPLPYLT